MDSSPLQELIQRAQLASERMSRTNPHRVLLHDMAVAVVSLAKMNTEMAKQLADKPRIIVP